MMDLSGLIDMDYFWWVFNKIAGFGVIFLVVFIAIEAGGWLLGTIIGAIRRMRS